MTEARWKPSVTVAAVIERDGRYLLVEEQTSTGLRLNNPAGHLEPGESLAQAVVREALEETARHFAPSHLVGVYLARVISQRSGEEVTYLRFAFDGAAGEAEPGRPLDAPVLRTLWMTLDEVRAESGRLRSPLVLRCLEDHQAGRRYPLEMLAADPSVWASSAGA
ncbi:MAG TPA: NUDIX hydrolase [Ideonella sp.]|nr:NUDIX hydrolase [Ideonella sp.]